MKTDRRTKSFGTAVVAVAIAIVAALAVVFTLPGDADIERPDRDGVLEIVLESYSFEPSEFAIPAGEPVTLVFDNRHETTHNLVFGRSVVDQDGRPVGFEEDLLVGLDAQVSPARAWIEPQPPHQNVTLSVPGRGTVVLEVTIPEERAGTWRAGCFVGPGCDPQVSMAAEITVE